MDAVETCKGSVIAGDSSGRCYGDQVLECKPRRLDGIPLHESLVDRDRLASTSTSLESLSIDYMLETLNSHDLVSRAMAVPYILSFRIEVPHQKDGL